MIYRKIVVTAVFLFAALIANACITYAQQLEIRFWPEATVYPNIILEGGMFDCNIQNMAVINRSGKTVTLEQCQLRLLNKGQVTEDVYISLSQMPQHFAGFHGNYSRGGLEAWEPEFQLNRLFKKAKLVGTLKLGNNEGISLRDRYFQFNGAVDTLQIIFSGKAEDGSAVQSSVKLAMEVYQSKTPLILPLKGSWNVGNGPYPHVTHRWVNHQEFGYDFIKMDGEGEVYKGSPTRMQDYYSYDQEIIAPADGVIFSTRNDGNDAPLLNDALLKPGEFMQKIQAYRDSLLGAGGYNEMFGNHIVIDHGTGEYSILVHVKKGSIRVKKGDRVKQGDILGLVGNSGLSNVPHLHYELVSNPDRMVGRGLPLRLSNLNDQPGSRVLRFGEFVKNGTTQ
ncbi:MAG TPA: M23 family metallopeptidase [Bacteroidota bacterium]